MSYNHPRQVTEAIHEFNGGLRPGDEGAEKQKDRKLKVETYDLKDFFTNVPRARFRQDVLDALELIRARSPGVRWF